MSSRKDPAHAFTAPALEKRSAPPSTLALSQYIPSWRWLNWIVQKTPWWVDYLAAAYTLHRLEKRNECKVTRKSSLLLLVNVLNTILIYLSQDISLRKHGGCRKWGAPTSAEIQIQRLTPWGPNFAEWRQVSRQKVQQKCMHTSIRLHDTNLKFLTLAQTSMLRFI